MKSSLTVCYWKRPIESKEVNPYLYFLKDGDNVVWDEPELLMPPKFLKIPSTALFEYGGSHTEALSVLCYSGFDDIIEVQNV